MSECLIGGIQADKYSVEAGELSVIFPGGIQIGDDEAKVLSKYGETDDEYKGESSSDYSWYDDGSYENRCQIIVDAKEKTVSQMTLIRHE